MNLNRFNYLLHHYQSGTASPQELLEFKAMLNSGLYQDAVKQDIAHVMKSLAESEETVEGINEDELFKQILERVRPSGSVEVISLNRLWYAAATVLLCLGLAWYFLKGSPEPKNQLAQQTKETESVENIIRFTNKDFIHLPDGSTVLLNEGSELSYDSSFGKEYRQVTLRGEAYFDIKKDPDHPFIVDAGKVKTRVLGTAFNINSKDNKVIVTVTRGLVEVGDDKQIFGKIRPDHQITVNTTKNDFVMKAIKADSSISWKNQNIVLDGISMAEASEVIGRKFGVAIKIKNDDIRNCRVSAWFLHNEDLTTILDLVTGTRQATYTLGNNQVTISGGIGCE